MRLYECDIEPPGSLYCLEYLMKCGDGVIAVAAEEATNHVTPWFSGLGSA